MRLDYLTVDVFTRTRFGGNPLAVVVDAEHLDTGQMQAVAREFSYSETVFVLPPADPRHRARLRIFTPVGEVPFAGHPNVGAAFVLAGMECGPERPHQLVFEEQAGLVTCDIAYEDECVDKVFITAPQALSTGARFSPAQTASCLSLSADQVIATRHEPVIASLGLPFLVVEIASRAGLRDARVDIREIARILPTEGADAIYLYTTDTGPEDGEVDITARMFAPWDGVPEDPATGSATGAACALIAASGPGSGDVRRFRVAQGIDMGRPSLLEIEVPEGQAGVRIGGACVPVMSGTIEI